MNLIINWEFCFLFAIYTGDLEAMTLPVKTLVIPNSNERVQAVIDDQGLPIGGRTKVLSGSFRRWIEGEVLGGL